MQLQQEITFGEGPYFTFLHALDHYEKHCEEQVSKDAGRQFEKELRMVRNMRTSLEENGFVLSEMCWD